MLLVQLTTRPIRSSFFGWGGVGWDVLLLVFCCCSWLLFFSHKIRISFMQSMSLARM